MANQANEWTDKEVEALQRKYRSIYGQASNEMRQRLEEFMADFDKQNADWKKRLSAGTVTRKEYDDWLRDMATDRAWVDGMARRLASDAVNADKLAVDALRGMLPAVYAENANMAAFEVESGVGISTGMFDLYDEDTVRRLIIEEPDLLPPVEVDGNRDFRWNRQKMSAAITQSILQGESIPRAARRLASVMGMDERSAVRAARTAITGAENAGRIDSYKRAIGMGIKMEQQWMATLDLRTRHSHRELDGQHVPVGEKFKVDGIELEYPADPSAPPEYVYNCRCTLVAWFPDIDQEDPTRWSKLPKGMTYEEWKRKRAQAANTTSNVPEGNDAPTRHTNMSNPLWSQLGPVDRNAVANKVEQLLSGAHGNSASLWSAYEDRVRMVDPTHTGGAYYRYGDRGVHMNVQGSLDDVDRRGALSTWFHEFGHNIDYLAGERWNARTTTFESGRFAETLKREVDGYIRGRQRDFNDMLRSRDLQGLLDAGVIRHWNGFAVQDYYNVMAHIDDLGWLGSNGWSFVAQAGDRAARENMIWERTLSYVGLEGHNTVPIQTARDAVGREITGSGLDSQLALGDIFEGATKGRCQDTYGHGVGYWDNNGDALAKEAFAEFFSAECIYSERPEILDIMMGRLPESYSVYSEIVEAMINA